MSNVLDRLQDADQTQPPQQWYLRTDDGSVYGPVDLAVMRDWAAQSRIAPGNSISPDGKSWFAAETIPDLKMEWMAHLPDGLNYGPFNVLAVPNLYESGAIPVTATLVHALTGKTVKVADLLRSQGIEQEEDKKPLEKAKEEKWKTLYHDEKKARLDHEAELQRELDKLRDHISESEDELSKLRDAADRELQELTLLEIDSVSKEKRLASTTARFEKDLKEHQHVEEQLKQDIANHEKALNEERSAASEQIKKLRNEIDSLNVRIEILSSDAMRQESETSAKQTSLDDHLKSWAARERELQSELDRLKASEEKKTLRESNLQLEEEKERLERLLKQLKLNTVESGSSLGTLQKQLAEAAAEHQNFKKLASIENDKLKSQIAELDKKLDIANDQLARSSGNLSDRATEIESLRSQAQQAQDRLDREIRELQQSLRSQKEAYEAELSRKQQKSVSLQAKLQQTKETVEADASLLSQTRERITQLEHELAEREAAFSAEGLRKKLSEKDAAAARLSDEVSLLQQHLAESNTQLAKLQADHTQLREASAQTEKDLREKAGKSSAQFSDLRNSTDQQISDLQKTSNDLRTRLETSIAEGSQLTERLDDALAHLASTERTSAKENKSLAAKVQHLEARLEKKSRSLEQTTEEFNRTKVEGSTSEHTLRATLRMLEKRDIAGRKHAQQLDSQVKELETEKRDLSRENSALAEEVKDAVAQLTNLRKQVAPLSRKIEVQEELLRRKLSRPVAGAALPSKTGPLSLRLVYLKLRLGKIASAIGSGSPEKRIAAVLAVLVVLIVAVSSVTRLLHEETISPAEPAKPAASSQSIISAFMKDAPDLSLAPAGSALVTEDTEKVHSWPGINVKGVDVNYGDFECSLAFFPALFSQGLELEREGSGRLSAITANHGASIRDYRIVIIGLSEADQKETNGDALEDYSLRINRASVVRKIMLAHGLLNPTNVLIVAGGPSDPAAKSAIITLQMAK